MFKVLAAIDSYENKVTPDLEPVVQRVQFLLGLEEGTGKYRLTAWWPDLKQGVGGYITADLLASLLPHFSQRT